MISKLLPFIFFFFLFAWSSCGDKIVFSQEQKIPDGNWNFDKPIKFSFEAPDTLNAYDLLLQVEHDIDFEYQNFYVSIRTTTPTGDQDKQQLSLNLADNMGNWRGQCTNASCKAAIGLLLNTFFPNLGKYQIEIIQDSRENPLDGILGFTLLIESREKAR